MEKKTDRERRTYKTSLALTPSERDKLKALAVRENMTPSDWMREQIRRAYL